MSVCVVFSVSESRPRMAQYGICLLQQITAGAGVCSNCRSEFGQVQFMSSTEIVDNGPAVLYERECDRKLSSYFWFAD